jgi:hypothetical protein
MESEVKKMVVALYAEIHPRKPEQKLNDAITARAHFQEAAFRCENEAQDKIEQAACFRVRVDELTEAIAAMQKPSAL